VTVVVRRFGDDPDLRTGFRAVSGQNTRTALDGRVVQFVELTEPEWVRLITWVDANGPYYGSYFGRRNLIYGDRPDFRPEPTLEAARGLPPDSIPTREWSRRWPLAVER
jgi:hypothetical protein